MTPYSRRSRSLVVFLHCTISTTPALHYRGQWPCHVVNDTAWTHFRQKLTDAVRRRSEAEINFCPQNFIVHCQDTAYQFLSKLVKYCRSSDEKYFSVFYASQCIELSDLFDGWFQVQHPQLKNVDEISGLQSFKVRIFLKFSKTLATNKVNALLKKLVKSVGLGCQKHMRYKYNFH